jgi:hypothetical protein
MLRHLLWIGILTIFVQSTNAQIPGYLGKRISLQADVQTIQTFLGPTANNRGRVYYGEKGGGYAWNWRAGLSAGYALSRQKQLVIGYDYLVTGLALDVNSESYDQIFDITYTDQHQLFYNLEVNTVTLGLRNFNPIKGGIAPFGKYKGWFFEYSNIKGKILDKKTILQDVGFNRTSHGPLGLSSKSNLYVLGYAMGENIILKDRFLLNIGARLRIPLNYDFFTHLEQDYDNGIDTFKAYSKDRISVHSLLTINVGAGFLF